MELAAGTMVNPRVRLLAPLGCGAMGSVWTAEHLTLEIEVAVKFIKPELASGEVDEGILARFRREGQAAAKIKSPHVVQTYDQGVMADGTPYLVMELLAGETLGERLKRTGRVELREAAQIVEQICRGLAKAHELGIVHRDIKPDNVFLCGAGDELLVKIVDFGVAKLVHLPEGSATATGTLVGTPQYMSPEQLLRAGEPGPEIDLWALAVLAYQAIVGHLPFAGDTLAGIIVAITQGRFTRPSKVDQRFAGPIDGWFERALAVEATDRFGTAKELARAFRQAVAEAPNGSAGRCDDRSQPSAPPPPEPAASAPEPATSALAGTAEFIAGEQLDVVSDGSPTAKKKTAPVPAAERAAVEEAETESEAEEEAERAEAARPPGRAAVEETERAALTQRSVEEQAAATTAVPVRLERSARSRPASLLRRAALGVAALGLVAFGYWMAQPEPPAGPTGKATATTTSAPTASPIGSGARAPAAPLTSATGTSIAPATSGTTRSEARAVQAGRTPDGAIWLAGFRLVRPPNDTGASYLEAHAPCRRRSLGLCTEAQWQLACAQDPALGSVATWTASADADGGFVVRGGGGCAARAVVAPADRSAERAGLCCERVVGIVSDNDNPSFIQATAAKIGRIEQAFTSGDRSLLAALVGERVRYRKEVLASGAFVSRAAKMFQLKPDGWILHDVCNVSLLDEEGEHGWSAECRCVTQQGRLLGVWLRRYVHDSATGKLRSIEVPKVYRAASEP